MFFLYKEPKIIKMWMHNKECFGYNFIDEFNKVISVNYGKPYSKKLFLLKKSLQYRKFLINVQKIKFKKGVEVSWANVSKNKKTKNDIIIV